MKVLQGLQIIKDLPPSAACSHDRPPLGKITHLLQAQGIAFNAGRGMGLANDGFPAQGDLPFRYQVSMLNHFLRPGNLCQAIQDGVRDGVTRFEHGAIVLQHSRIDNLNDNLIDNRLMFAFSVLRVRLVAD